MTRPGRARLCARAVAGLVIVGGLLAVAPIAASADVALTTATPAAGALLPAAPREARLIFSGTVAADAVTVTVDVDGQRLGSTRTSTAGSSVRVAIPSTSAGAAEQQWRIAYQVLAADGHPAAGRVDFSVAAPATTPSTTPAAPVSPTPTATPRVPGMPTEDDQHRASSRWYFFAIGALLLLIGPAAFLFLGTGSPDDDTASPHGFDQPPADDAAVGDPPPPATLVDTPPDPAGQTPPTPEVGGIRTTDDDPPSERQDQ